MPSQMKTDKENRPKHDVKESQRKNYHAVYKTKTNSMEFELKWKLNMCKKNTMVVNIFCQHGASKVIPYKKGIMSVDVSNPMYPVT